LPTAGPRAGPTRIGKPPADLPPNLEPNLETIVAGIPMDPADTDTTRPDAPAPAAAHEPSITAGPCARALLDALPSAAYTCDADGRIT